MENRQGAGGEHKLLRHLNLGHHKDVLQILLGVEQLCQVLLPFIEHHDLIAGVLLEEEQLAGIGGRVMGQGLYPLDELQQHPHCQDDPLVRGAIGVQPQVVAIPHIRDTLVPLHAVQQPFRRGRGLVPQQPHHLGLGQRPVLGKPFDYVLFVCQKHGVTPYAFSFWNVFFLPEHA